VNWIRQVTHDHTILIVVRQHRFVFISAIHRPTLGEMGVGHHLHHVTLVGTRLPTAGMMTAGHYRHHRALAGMMIDEAAVAALSSTRRSTSDEDTEDRTPGSPS